ncbi:hypothetical protein F442_09186 [Phytophthora nicotianae P10297]|uniref:Uncharacterized protein n=1 Tax=Phytophthora nicotianae P10297 TaxID=1317064 RepID=W2ZA20_PHYNI|nr:hypothetical protein F442_09186 [Phytophthora nicotianae P10297]
MQRELLKRPKEWRRRGEIQGAESSAAIDEQEAESSSEEAWSSDEGEEREEESSHTKAAVATKPYGIQMIYIATG